MSDNILDQNKIKYKKPTLLPERRGILKDMWEEYIDKDYFILKISRIRIPITLLSKPENVAIFFISSFIYFFSMLIPGNSYSLTFIIYSIFLISLSGLLYLYKLFRRGFSSFKGGILYLYYSNHENLLIIHKDGELVLKAQFLFSEVDSFFVGKSGFKPADGDFEKNSYYISVDHLCVQLKQHHLSLKPVENGYKICHLYEKNSPGTWDAFNMTSYAEEGSHELNRKKMETLALYLNELLKTFPKGCLKDINP